MRRGTSPETWSVVAPQQGAQRSRNSGGRGVPGGYQGVPRGGFGGDCIMNSSVLPMVYKNRRLPPELRYRLDARAHPPGQQFPANTVFYRAESGDVPAGLRQAPDRQKACGGPCLPLFERQLASGRSPLALLPLRQCCDGGGRRGTCCCHCETPRAKVSRAPLKVSPTWLSAPNALAKAATPH